MNKKYSIDNLSNDIQVVLNTYYSDTTIKDNYISKRHINNS